MKLLEVKPRREQVQARLRDRARTATWIGYAFGAAGVLAFLLEYLPSWFGLAPGSQPNELIALALAPGLVVDGLAQHWRTKADNLPEDLSLTEYA